MGRKIELSWADTADDPTRTVSEVKRLIEQEHIHALWGPPVAASALAAAPEVTRARIFSIPFTGARTLTPKVYPYGFPIFYASDAFSRAMFDYAVGELKAKTVAAIVDTGAQGKSAGGDFVAYAQKSGVKLALEESDPASLDLTPQILNLRRSGADVILLVSPSSNLVVRAVEGTRSVGWNVPIVSQTAALLPNEVKAAVPDAFSAGKLIGLTLKASTMCQGDDPAKSPYVQLIAKIKAAAPSEWQRLSLPIASYYYDGIYLIKFAMEGARSVEGPAMAAWLEENAKSVTIVSGPISPTKADHILFGPDVFAFVKRPDQPNPSGLTVREGC
jgi:ABC-type branched-subunit amino acid transport system substrate-binding protein